MSLSRMLNRVTFCSPYSYVNSGVFLVLCVKVIGT
jgi:hypothetical protein